MRSEATLYRAQKWVHKKTDCQRDLPALPLPLRMIVGMRYIAGIVLLIPVIRYW